MGFNSSIYGMPVIVGSGPVLTVFGRNGPSILAQTGDYTAVMVGADPTGTANSVLLTHINELDPHIQYALKTDLEAYFDSAIAYFDSHILIP